MGDELKITESPIKESVSSIEITKNTKGWTGTLKVYASSSQEELDSLKLKAYGLADDLAKKLKLLEKGEN